MTLEFAILEKGFMDAFDGAVEDWGDHWNGLAICQSRTVPAKSPEANSWL